MATIYDPLDSWWGERFGPEIGDRIALPLDQAVSLYEHVAKAKIPEFTESSLPYALEPVVRPWVTEMHEINRAVAQARLTTSMILGEVGTYGFVHYWGVHRIDGSDPKVSHPVGPFGVVTQENGWPNLEARILRLNMLAMYAHRVRLAIHDVLPRMPDPELPDGARAAWLNDVNRRLAILAKLRPLQSTGAVDFGRPPAAQEEASARLESSSEWRISDDDEEDFLQNLQFAIKGSSERIANPEAWFRHWIAQNLMAKQMLVMFNNATVPGGHVLAETSIAERAFGATIAETTTLPSSRLMQRYIDLKLPVPTGNVAEVCAATYNLRRDNDSFERWRAGLTDSLTAMSFMVKDEAPLQQVRAAFAEHLRPGVKSVQREIDKQTNMRAGLKSAATGLVVGGVGLSGAVLAGDSLAQNAASLGGATVTSAVIQFLASRRARNSPEWDAYVALGLHRP